MKKTCKVCDVNLKEIEEVYDVSDDILRGTKYRWDALCVGCLEFVIKRKLIYLDFVESARNAQNYQGGCSSRLLQRMEGFTHEFPQYPRGYSASEVMLSPGRMMDSEPTYWEPEL